MVQLINPMDKGYTTNHRISSEKTILLPKDEFCFALLIKLL